MSPTTPITLAFSEVITRNYMERTMSRFLSCRFSWLHSCILSYGSSRCRYLYACVRSHHFFALARAVNLNSLFRDTPHDIWIGGKVAFRQWLGLKVGTMKLLDLRQVPLDFFCEFLCSRKLFQMCSVIHLRHGSQPGIQVATVYFSVHLVSKCKLRKRK